MSRKQRVKWICKARGPKYNNWGICQKGSKYKGSGKVYQIDEEINGSFQEDDCVDDMWERDWSSIIVLDHVMITWEKITVGLCK